ncbi:MAG: hypothetical protein Q4C53_04035 [Clostridia bacterium]|nr:hypothetical protein [Clostridia bacterium]
MKRNTLLRAVPLLAALLTTAVLPGSAMGNGRTPETPADALTDALKPEALLAAAPCVEWTCTREDGTKDFIRWQKTNGVHRYCARTEFPEGRTDAICLSDAPEDLFVYRLKADGSFARTPYSGADFALLWTEDVLGLGRMEPESYAADNEGGLWRIEYEGFFGNDEATSVWTLTYDPETARFRSAECKRPDGTALSGSFTYLDRTPQPLCPARACFSE